MRSALLSLVWLIGTLAVLFGAAAAYYAFDDELSSDAKALLAAPPGLAEPTDANGYVAFLGLGAPSGQDQIGWGKKVAAALRAQDAAGFKKDAAWEDTVKPHLAVTKGVVAWCAPEKQSCLAVAREKGEALAKLLEDNREVLARYRALREKPVYDDAYVPTRVESWLPPFHLIASAQWLALLAINLKAAAGDLEGAIGELEQETAFHGRFAAGTRTVLGGNIAAALIARDALVLSDLIVANRSGIAPYAARVQAMARQLGTNFGLREASFRTEVYLGAKQLIELRPSILAGNSPFPENAPISMVTVLFYRPNATVNTVVAIHKEQFAILGNGAPDFDRAMARADEAARSLEVPGWADILRNPVGCLLLANVSHSYAEHFARAHNVTGLVRLVALQAAVAGQGIESPEAIAQFVAGEEAKPYADPFTGKPMAWDAASRQLYFQPRGRGTGWIEALKTRYKGRIAVTL